MKHKNLGPESHNKSRTNDDRYHEDLGYNEYQKLQHRSDDRNPGNRGDYNTGNDRNNYPEDRADRYNRSYDHERMSSDNDRNSNRGVYGNSTGVNRSDTPYDQSDERNSRNRQYGGSDYAHYPEKYRNKEGNRDNRDWWDRTKDEVSAWFGDDEAERRRHMDDLRQKHKGKGPKGYNRSDNRILEDVNERLTDDSHIDASNIEVEVKDGEVTLKGTVGSKMAKRHAEDITDRVSGVRDVQNRLKVDSSNEDEYTIGTGASTSGAYGVPYGSSGAAPVGAFNIRNQ